MSRHRIRRDASASNLQHASFLVPIIELKSRCCVAAVDDRQVTIEIRHTANGYLVGFTPLPTEYPFFLVRFGAVVNEDRVSRHEVLPGYVAYISVALAWAYFVGGSI